MGERKEFFQSATPPRDPKAPKETSFQLNSIAALITKEKYKVADAFLIKYTQWANTNQEFVSLPLLQYYQLKSNRRAIQKDELPILINQAKSLGNLIGAKKLSGMLEHE